MRSSLVQILNQTTEVIRCLIGPRILIVSDGYALRQSCGQKRHSQRPPARRR